MTSGETRKIGPVLAAFLVAGNIIGAGIYALPAEVGAVGSVGVLGWLVAGVGAFAVGAGLSLLANVTYDPDGMVGYVRRELSPFWGFVTGLVYWLSNVVGGVGTAIIAAGYLTVYFPEVGTPFARSLAGFGAIWLTVGVCLFGPRATGRFSAVFLVAGLAPLLLLATVGWAYFDPKLFIRSWNVSGHSDLSAVKSSVLGAFWAFTGMESGPMISSVVRDPKRNVPFATLAGLSLAGVVYFAVIIVILGLEPARAYAASGAPLALAVSRIGPIWADLIAACALIKVLGTMCGMAYVTAETARAILDVRPFSAPPTGDRARSVRAILLWTAGGMALAALATTSPTFERQFSGLIDLSAIWSLIPYLFCMIALALIARGLKGAVRWGAYAIASVAFAVTGFVCLTAKPLSLGLTVALALASVVYWGWISRSRPATA